MKNMNYTEPNGLKRHWFKGNGQEVSDMTELKDLIKQYHDDSQAEENNERAHELHAIEADLDEFYDTLWRLLKLAETLRGEGGPRQFTMEYNQKTITVDLHRFTISAE